MDDLTFSDILRTQRDLQAVHPEWLPLVPKNARSSLLWMVEEVGETAAIIKKKGDDAILHDAPVRSAFLEEMCDVLMYFSAVMISYNISERELADAFFAKHNGNMHRDFQRDNDALYGNPVEE